MKKYLFLILVFLVPYGVCAQPLRQAPEQPSPAKVAASQQRATNFCDPNYVGEEISFSMSTPLPLDSLVDQIHRRFGINFLLGEGVKDLPVNIKSGSLPWNVLLNSQLYLSGVTAKCINDNTVLLIKNKQRKELDDEQFNNAELKTEFIKLKFLQPTTTTNVNIAGQSSGQQGGNGNNGQCGNMGGGSGSGGNGGNSGGNSGNGSGGCGNFEKLKYEIENILGLHDSKNVITAERSDASQNANNELQPVSVPRSGAVAVIPGRNILVVRGTEEQLVLIKKFIELADRPPFQVVIKGLVYTANEDRLRDIGTTNILADWTNTGTPKPKGGIFSSSTITGLFDFSALIGTVDFNIQASALQRNGVISIKARPFAIVLDGDPTELEVGRQIPVLTQGSVNGGDAGALEFIGATNKLAVVPHVIDDENGNPTAVNLELLLQSNEVDVAVISQGIPTVNERSIQSRLILSQDKTVILGGFTIDSVNDSVSKTPGLGDIPLLGYLFKRKVRTDQISRLYFALSVTVVPYGQILEPITVPGATTEVPGVTPDVKKREENLQKRNQ